MFETKPNQRTVTVKMTRKDLCDLLIACTSSNFSAREMARERGEEVTETHWKRLHDLLERQLADHDKKYEEKE